METVKEIKTIDQDWLDQYGPWIQGKLKKDGKSMPDFKVGEEIVWERVPTTKGELRYNHAEPSYKLVQDIRFSGKRGLDCPHDQPMWKHPDWTYVGTKGDHVVQIYYRGEALFKFVDGEDSTS